MIEKESNNLARFETLNPWPEEFYSTGWATCVCSVVQIRLLLPLGVVPTPSTPSRQSYNAVPPPGTHSEATPPSQPPSSTQPERDQPAPQGKFPPGFSTYINKAFASCSTAEERDKLHKYLDNEMNKLFSDKKQWEIDWDSYPLPRYVPLNVRHKSWFQLQQLT